MKQPPPVIEAEFEVVSEGRQRLESRFPPEPPTGLLILGILRIVGGKLLYIAVVIALTTCAFFLAMTLRDWLL